MIAEIVDLPLCLEQLRSTRSEEEPSKSSCHESGSTPRARANAARSRASLRSSLSSTIVCALQGLQNGSTRGWVGFQGSDDDGAQLQPLRRDSNVYCGALV